MSEKDLMLTENNEKITKTATETNFIVQIYFWTARQKLYNLEALKSVFIFGWIFCSKLSSAFLTHLISI